MRSRKHRAKAMKIAAVADGVNSVAFNEEKKDQMVIIGDGVDAASLALCLRKKQKITIEAQIQCDKCRSQAMKIAVAEDGVISVAFQGPNRDKMVITGDGVDAADMAKSLRKKLGYADLVSVEEITEKKA
ncbi:PREDICTED: heavy [Prunus dulcis]|uniref:PREDICTED: heavy n=1 Tax=Prunus dulcis TaxID=3755 RepID=A0A5E4G6A3_PRUDU|nr:PREDICTED: heavy [Prunus dulcis]